MNLQNKFFMTSVGTLCVVIGLVFFLQVRFGEATSFQPRSGWKGFNSDFFSVSYPSDFKLYSGLGLSGSYLGASLAKLEFPNEYFDRKGTNFQQAHLVVSRTEVPERMTLCKTFSDVIASPGAEIKKVEIEDTEFRSVSVSRLEAGNLYESEIYRAIRGSQCFEVAITVQTGSLQNYNPAVLEFETSEALVPLKDIFQTIRFKK